MKGFRALALRLLGARRGRLLGLLFLVAAGPLLIQAERTPLAGVRQLLFDHYQRLLPRDRSAAPAIVVEIDEKSLARHGQWPWTRTLVADLVNRLLAGQPYALGLDILFVEPDRLSPTQLTRQLGLSAQALAGVVDPDQQLAAALAAGPTVLAASGVSSSVPAARPLERSPALVSQGSNPLGDLPAYPATLTSLPALSRAAAGLGLINAPPDRAGEDSERGVIRRLPLLGRIGDAVLPTLGLEMVRQALGGEPIRSEADSRGLVRVGTGDYRLPVDADGQVRLHFGPMAGDRYLSAADLLAGTYPAENLKGRFVLLGLTGIGLTDRVITPLGENVPGIEIHAQLIESLLAGDALRRPGWMPGVELAVLVLGGLFLIVAVPALRPTYAASLGFALAALVMAGGFAAFAAGHWLFDGATVVVLLNPLFITLLGNTLIEADQRRRIAERKLQSSREAAARDAGELDAARRIQMGMLPDPASVFADESRLALGAVLEPARAVGGDYYDCFAIDRRHVCFGIGDVSGKGVPASLFMTVAKTLGEALTRRIDDLGIAMRQVETELNRHNPEILFVTTFVAVLDADTGHLACVCAGHDAPVLRRGETILRLDLGDAAAPPVCAVGNYPFVTVSRQLEPGDLVCLFTDGVTEATDGKGFYGIDRLLAAIAGLPADSSPQAAADAVRQSVRQFEAGHLPADDLTVLALRWHGPATLSER